MNQESRGQQLITKIDELSQIIENQTEKIKNLENALNGTSKIISLKFQEKNTTIINLDKVVKEMKKRNNPNVQLHELSGIPPEDVFISYVENEILHIWAYGLK